MILTPKQKAVYRLREREGKTQVAIAEELGLSQPEVSRLLSRARNRILQFVGNCPGGERCEIVNGILN
jgi:RNA polymerase sigma factor (sigma-70 family)